MESDKAAFQNPKGSLSGHFMFSMWILSSVQSICVLQSSTVHSKTFQGENIHGFCNLPVNCN